MTTRTWHVDTRSAACDPPRLDEKVAQGKTFCRPLVNPCELSWEMKVVSKQEKTKKASYVNALGTTALVVLFWSRDVAPKN